MTIKQRSQWESPEIFPFFTWYFPMTFLVIYRRTLLSIHFKEISTQNFPKDILVIIYQRKIYFNPFLGKCSGLRDFNCLYILTVSREKVPEGPDTL